jgi:hypothetical protein
MVLIGHHSLFFSQQGLDLLTVALGLDFFSLWQPLVDLLSAFLIALLVISTRHLIPLI